MKALVGNSSRTSDVDFVPRMGNYMVTPEMAQEWLDLFSYENQRKMRAYHVAILAKEMAEGRFREYTQIAFCQGLWDGWYYLTNGYHTLTAIIQSQQAVLLSVVVKPVNSLREVADDYGRHDSGLKRTLSDALSVHELHTHLGITKSQLGFVSTASLYCAFLCGEASTYEKLSQSSVDQKRKIILKYGPLGRSALNHYDGGTSYRSLGLTKRAVLAINMLTTEKQPLLAEHFWRGIASDNGLLKKDPRKTLLDWLRDATTKGGGFYKSPNKRAYSNDQFVKAISVAWNAFHEKRQISFLRFDSSAREVVFKGVGTFRV